MKRVCCPLSMLPCAQNGSLVYTALLLHSSAFCSRHFFPLVAHHLACAGRDRSRHEKYEESNALTLHLFHHGHPESSFSTARALHSSFSLDSLVFLFSPPLFPSSPLLPLLCLPQQLSLGTKRGSLWQKKTRDKEERGPSAG